MQVAIWSDVVCPWCYLGTRRFAAALEQVAPDLPPGAIEVVHRPFQLDPEAPSGTGELVHDHYSVRYGAERFAAMTQRVTDLAAAEGLVLRLDRTLRANTFDAHRVIWMAARHGDDLAGRVEQELFRAYFTEGADIAAHATLRRCAQAVGLASTEVDEVLGTDLGAAQVRALMRSAREQGITAVPTFVIDGELAIPGAQEVATFAAILRRLASGTGQPSSSMP